MAKYTSNYNLHQWEPGDNFLRTDFNEDFAKIDAALAGKPDQADLSALQTVVNGKAQVVTGSYTGNGTTRTIALGFQPKLVVVPVSGCYTATAIPGSTTTPLTITASGFQAKHRTEGSSPNVADTAYFYFAVR